MVILEFDFKSLNDKIVNSALLLHSAKRKNVRNKMGDPVAFL